MRCPSSPRRAARRVADGRGEVRLQIVHPFGLFGSPGDGALAVFTGHILAAGDRRNGLTGEVFCWTLVETLGGVFDVVIDSELITETPQVGGVLSGSFWLSGRVSG